ncbi:peptidoglycan-binding protein LysM [Caloranaerobacter sp. TR13]|uniref:LysM peptidoglycan-binding domain-containing protein n=1 Tax=Caloranaerobacter sp. TR13 TaxID=1302151 RepID=UPI0006D3D070|nr:LysM peptidoglycan-binding domain-containing protein [Caloranaerobacter sp. TR13]KPU26705.1 peptidoglycan-binding protein LysM [Caloranaerobacter sp. TR13]
MKNIRKILAGTLAVTIIGTSSSVFAWTYEVKPGDTYWKISQKYGISIGTLMKVNNANENTILYVGDKLNIPESEDFFYYVVKKGDTPYLISKKFGVKLDELLKINGLNSSSIIYPGDKLRIPINTNSSTNTDSNTNNTSTNASKSQSSINFETKTTKTYTTHIVQPGDDFWKISQKYGIPMYELMKVNNANDKTVLYVGDKLLIPVYNVSVMETVGEKYGEYLDWWKGVQYLIPIGAEFKVVDFYTGKSFMAKRTTGTNHADVETLTADDTKKLIEIWGGRFSWTRRPVIIEYKGRRIAASASGMPHAGNDNAPGGVYTSWRSGGYSGGVNLDYIKGNDMNGVFDIHFLNSTRHKDGKIDEKHQYCVKVAAGLIK